MTVTGIEEVTKTKSAVYIDGKFAFELYRGELSRYHITVGQEIEKDVRGRILSETVAKRAKLKALGLLGDMGRTETQLRQKLKACRYPDDVVEEAVRYVKSFGYVNDRSYAADFIESRKDRKSRRELRGLLAQKGVDREVIDEAMEECYGSGDAGTAIRRLLEKKHYDPESADRRETQRVMAYLARKGFDCDDIQRALDIFVKTV